MPRRIVCNRELGSLVTAGGVSGRRPIREEPEWNFNCGYHCSVITPADAMADDSTVGSSFESMLDTDSYDDCSSDAASHEGMTRPRIMEGNRLIPLQSLVSTIQEYTVCHHCAQAKTDRLFEEFLLYCEHTVTEVMRQTMNRSLEWQLRVLKEELNIRKMHNDWSVRQKAANAQTEVKKLDIRHNTYGLATSLEIHCPTCKSSGKIMAKKRREFFGRSDLCHYDINVKYCTALQLMGVGGEHAAIMAAFLDLPEAHKWPRQFSVLEKHLFKYLDRIKEESQILAAEEEVEETLIDNDNVVLQTYLERDTPIHRVDASFDMGWQVRSSGGKYGSSTGHALLIGARTKKVLDSVIFNKKCGICTKHEKRTGSVDNVRKHICVKNFDGSSKSMEAAALGKMLMRVPQQKGISICSITSDDDSNARAKARHETNGGLLPLTIEEPKFRADPSHRKRVFAKGIYNLANAPVKVSTVTKGLAAHLKYCYGACVKRYRHLSAAELSQKVYNILDHITDNHENCHESWCYNKKATIQNKTYTAPADHRIDRNKHSMAYEQLKKIFDVYASVDQMGYCNHTFDTQTNEALNQSIANVAPKSVCYSSTTSLNGRIALVIGIHNYGHLPFITSYFDMVGVTVGNSLAGFLEKKTETKTIEKKISKAGYYKDKKKQTTAKDKRRGLQRKNG